jgi:diguanylate cyclase (GGDEF)-like protein
MSSDAPSPTHSIISSPSARVDGSETLEIKKNLRRLGRKDSWYWWNAVLVIMLLMGAIVVLSLPRLLQEDDPSLKLQITFVVRALLGFVLIFNVYTLFQQRLLRQLRNHLAGQIEIATEHKLRAETLYELAILDPLTGLYNRRFSDERLGAEILRAERNLLPLIVIVFDLDDFKQINDCFGHCTGDLVLKEFARRLGKASRGSDFAVRTGGDEFLLVLTECPPEKVPLVLSRLAPFGMDCEGKKIYVSSSHGWAQYHPSETPEQLIARADEALYRQKESHRLRALENLTA